MNLSKETEAKIGTDAKVTPSSISNSVARCLGWFCVFVIGPLFVLPKVFRLLKEFGIELPFVTQFAFAMNDRMLKFWFILLPFLAMMAIGAEVLLHYLPRGSNRKILNRLLWIAIFLSVGFYLVAIVPPIFNITEALANSKK